MLHNNTVFKELVERYPTWGELEAYLESEEGGRFRIVDRKEETCLIRYEKGVSNMELPHSKWFRSVAWNTRNNRPISVAPPKTTAEPFALSGEWVCQEWLEGFMINAYKLVGDDTLYITSRSRLEASGRFYSAKTFRHMFVEAYTGCKSNEGEPVECLIQEEAKNFPSPDTALGEMAVFVSFLVQHTEHRIVQPVQDNRLWAIHKGTVYDDGRIMIEDSPSAPPLTRWSQPTTYSIPEDTNVALWIQKEITVTPWTFQGFVVKDLLGNRWRFSSPTHLAVKSLRGNTPHSLERFVQLYQQNLFHIYLQYYPEDANLFTFHYESMMRLIEWIHIQYVALHVRHACGISDIDKMFHPHLYSLHGQYITRLRSSGKKLTANDVYEYLHTQPWQRVAFLLQRTEDTYLSLVRSET